MNKVRFHESNFMQSRVISGTGLRLNYTKTMLIFVISLMYPDRKI